MIVRNLTSNEIFLGFVDPSGVTLPASSTVTIANTYSNHPSILFLKNSDPSKIEITSYESGLSEGGYLTKGEEIPFDDTDTQLDADTVREAIVKLDERLDNLSTTAESITFDNADTNLTSEDVQGAIEELEGLLITTASDLTYDNDTSGLAAEDVQAAIDEVLEKTPVSTATSTSDITDLENKQFFLNTPVLTLPAGANTLSLTNIDTKILVYGDTRSNVARSFYTGVVLDGLNLTLTTDLGLVTTDTLTMISNTGTLETLTVDSYATSVVALTEAPVGTIGAKGSAIVIVPNRSISTTLTVTKPIGFVGIKFDNILTVDGTEVTLSGCYMPGLIVKNGGKVTFLNHNSVVNGVNGIEVNSSSIILGNVYVHKMTGIGMIVEENSMIKSSLQVITFCETGVKLFFGGCLLSDSSLVYKHTDGIVVWSCSTVKMVASAAEYCSRYGIKVCQNSLVYAPSVTYSNNGTNSFTESCGILIIS